MQSLNDPVAESIELAKSLKVEREKYLAGEATAKGVIENAQREFQGLLIAELATDAQKKAFWCNAYNALTSFLIIRFKLKGTMLANFPIYFVPKIKIGKQKFSLDDIEHGILRQNKRAPHKPWRQFSSSDEKNMLAPKDFDNRIHFALNCGAESCPAVAFYSGVNVEEELFMAEQSFVNQEFLVDHEARTISASAIFKMYKADFTNQYIFDPVYKNYKINIKPYNWQLK